MTTLRNALEGRQIGIYLAAVGAAIAVALMLPGATALEAGINPALALMLFVTFTQVPQRELGQSFARVRFLVALLTANFVAVPLLAVGLIQLLPASSMLRLGVLMVLLTPCIDYVVTFAHLGRADANVLLASTPVLLVAQMVLLPVYLTAFLGEEAAQFVQVGPFLHAFVWLIAVPLVLAAAVQILSGHSRAGIRIVESLGLLPVPATALVLFIVIAAVLPQLGPASGEALHVVPVYVVFAVVAPLLGWGVGRMFRLDVANGRALAFSAATRNSLVVLPLALAVPGAVPLLPAVVVTQTLVELMSEFVYVRLMPKLGTSRVAAATSG
jgi:arsenite transporter